MVTYYVRTSARGPLFDGLAAEALDRWANATGEELASQGQSEIRRRALLMHRSALPGHRWPGRVNTGEAARHVRVYSSRTSAWKISGESEAGITWWPWLEGVSRRNMTTRFKGYHTFRVVKNQLQRKARAVGEAVLRRMLPDMGGS